MSVDQQQQASDGVLNYSSAVLNDGPLMLELRDAIREGDGPWIIPCWKMMMIYFKHAKHVNYAEEVFRMLAMVAACFPILLINELGRHVTISLPNITAISSQSESRYAVTLSITAFLAHAPVTNTGGESSIQFSATKTSSSAGEISGI